MYKTAHSILFQQMSVSDSYLERLILNPLLAGIMNIYFCIFHFQHKHTINSYLT